MTSGRNLGYHIWNFGNNIFDLNAIVFNFKIWRLIHCMAHLRLLINHCGDEHVIVNIIGIYVRLFLFMYMLCLSICITLFFNFLTSTMIFLRKTHDGILLTGLASRLKYSMYNACVWFLILAIHWKSSLVKMKSHSGATYDINKKSGTV